MAYLMRAESITFETALYTVRQARNQVFPNAGFQEQLKLWGAMGCRIDPDSGAWRRYQLMAVGNRWIENAVQLWFRGVRMCRRFYATWISREQPRFH